MAGNIVLLIVVVERKGIVEKRNTAEKRRRRRRRRSNIVLVVVVRVVVVCNAAKKSIVAERRGIAWKRSTDGRMRRGIVEEEWIAEKKKNIDWRRKGIAERWRRGIAGKKRKKKRSIVDVVVDCLVFYTLS